jgi:O-antigen/teichoic acid export membrane protein
MTSPSLPAQTSVDSADLLPPGADPRPKPRKSYGKTARRSAVWDLGSKMTSQAVNMVISLFLARLLTPGDFGITAASRFFILLASRLTQLGLNVSLVRMKDLRNEHSSSVFVVNLVMGVIAYTSLALASPFLGRFFGSDHVAGVLPVSALIFLVTPFGTVASAMLQRNLQYRTGTIIAVCDSILGSLITLAMAWLGFGYWSLVWGSLIAAVISTGMRIYASPWRLSVRFSMSALKDTLSFGLGFQTKRLISFASTNIDNFIVGRFLGVVSLGHYDKAYGLMAQVTDRMTFDGALMRIFAIIHTEPERFRKALLRGIAATSIASTPLLMFVAVSADRLVPTLFGDQWGPAIGPLRVLAVSGMARSMARPIYAATEALGYVWRQVALSIVSLSVLVTGIAVGSRWGLTAASLGVLCATFLNVWLTINVLQRFSPVNKLDIWRSVWPSLATASLLGLAVAAEHWTLVQLGITRTGFLFAGDFATVAVVYPALLIWTPFASVAKVVRDSADDLVPWVVRRFPFGVFKPLAK